MIAYWTIREIRNLDSVLEVNRLLSKGWILLEICKFDFGPLFILGREFEELTDYENLEGDGVK